MIARIPLTAKVSVFIDEQPEGGYTVTSPLFPELITEGDTIEEVLRNIQEVFGMVIEDYVDEERPLPRGLFAEDTAVSLEPVVTTS
jgi:antitoxin HicB